MTLHQCHNKSFFILQTYCWDSFVNFLKREREKKVEGYPDCMNQPVCMSGGKTVFFKDIIGKERMTTNMFFLVEQFWLLHIDMMMTTMGGQKNILLLRTGLSGCLKTLPSMGSGLWVACMLPRPSLGVVKNASL